MQFTRKPQRAALLQPIANKRMPIKVIFLDIDGVLNCHSFREAANDYYDNPIDESRLLLLKYIIQQTGAVIVLSSTWRTYWNEGETQLHEEGARLNEIFRRHGLEIYSKTDDFGEDRNYEILLWLSGHQVTEYVILDDINFFGNGVNRLHLVQTDDTKEGLDEEATQRAIDILNGSL